MKKNVEAFPKSDTQIIKGLAILLMLMHHLWFFPDRIAGGELKYLFTFLGKASTNIMGSFGKICVSLFFFVGGYGIYKKSEEKDFNILKNIKKIYLNYWKIFLIFIPIGYLFFSNQKAYCTDPVIYSVFSKFSFSNLLPNFFGVSSTLNREWWFLEDYIVAIISFPFIKRLFENKSTSTNIFIIVIMTILMCNVFPTIGGYESLGVLNNNYLYYTFLCQAVPFVSCFWLGILFAKDNLFNNLIKKINEIVKFNPVFDIFGIISIIYLRQFVIGEILDILYVPILIVLFLDLVKRIPKLKELFTLLGNNSTNMWLIHSFYCYYFYEVVRVITYLKWSVPCLIVLILSSLFSSIIIDIIWKKLSTIANKIPKARKI